MSKLYHFCCQEFLERLIDTGEVKPVNQLYQGNRRRAYDILFQRLNNGNDMFFAWGALENKGDKIEYIEKDKVTDSTYVLLELDVPEDEFISTNYYNWCDLIWILEHGETPQGAGEIAQEEFGTPGKTPVEAFETIYSCVFNLEDGYHYEQMLLKTIKKEWITGIKYVANKII